MLHKVYFKPDGLKDYLYLPGTGAFRLSREITAPQELMSFVARSRSRGLGVLQGVQGVIQGGEVNLGVTLGFSGEPEDHSGQFHRNIQDPSVLGFYSLLYQSLFPPP